MKGLEALACGIVAGDTRRDAARRDAARRRARKHILAEYCWRGYVLPRGESRSGRSMEAPRASKVAPREGDNDFPATSLLSTAS